MCDEKYQLGKVQNRCIILTKSVENTRVHLGATLFSANDGFNTSQRNTHTHELVYQSGG